MGEIIMSIDCTYNTYNGDEASDLMRRSLLDMFKFIAVKMLVCLFERLIREPNGNVCMSITKTRLFKYEYIENFITKK